MWPIIIIVSSIIIILLLITFSLMSSSPAPSMGILPLILIILCCFVGYDEESAVKDKGKGDESGFTGTELIEIEEPSLAEEEQVLLEEILTYIEKNKEIIKPYNNFLLNLEDTNIAAGKKYTVEHSIVRPLVLYAVSLSEYEDKQLISFKKKKVNMNVKELEGVDYLINIKE